MDEVIQKPDDKEAKRKYINDQDRKIGLKVLKARTDAGLTRAEVSIYLGISNQQLEKYEKGMNRISASTLVALAKIFKRDISWFIQDLDDENVTRFNATDYQYDFIVRINRELKSIEDKNAQEKLVRIIKFFIKEENNDDKN